MIKRILFFALSLIFCLYYLSKEGYIHITPKGQEKMEKEITRLSTGGKDMLKKGMRKAIETGAEMAGEILNEATEEKIEHLKGPSPAPRKKETPSQYLLPQKYVQSPNQPEDNEADQWHPSTNEIH